MDPARYDLCKVLAFVRAWSLVRGHGSVSKCAGKLRKRCKPGEVLDEHLTMVRQGSVAALGRRHGAVY